MLASTLRGYNGLVSTAQGAVNVGLPLTQDGFLNLSLEYRQLDPTIRSGTRADAATLSARGYPVKDPAQIWGSPDIDGVWNTFFNADVDPSTVDVPSPDASFDEVEAFIDRYRGDLFLFNERFPGGFTPRFGADIRDMSLVGGLRGARDNGLKWDASVSAARSTIEFFIFGTINASLGPTTPTSLGQVDVDSTAFRPAVSAL